MRHALLLCLAALIITACDGESTLLPRDGTTISKQRAQWEQLALHSYDITQERMCYCPYGGAPVRLTVVADSIIQGINLLDSTQLAASELQWYLTVDGLFDFVSGIDPAQVAEFRLEWDSLYHYPSDTWVDRSLQIADEEIGYRSYDLVPR